MNFTKGLGQHSKLAGLAGWLLTAFALFWFIRLPGMFEPDRLFHLSVLREMQSQGTLVLRTWSQLPLLGWDQYFSDKEFLYHVLSYPLWRIFSETGYLASTALISSAVFWLPYFFLRTSRLKVVLVCAALILSSQYLIYRMNLPRPHILGVLCLEGFFLSLLGKRALPAALFGLAFSLAYHALYLPAALGGLVLADGIIRQQRATWRVGLAALFGLMVGILVNPYFPSNIFRSLQGLALGMNLSHLPEYIRARIGRELIPFTSLQYATILLPTVLLGGWSAWKLRRHRDYFPYFLFLAILWIGAIRTPRTVEFAAPLTAVIIALSWQKKSRPTAITLGLIFVWNAAFTISNGAYFFKPDGSQPPIAAYESFLKLIPAKATPTMVFHDRWDYASFAIYLRPDIQVPEVLDPTFLWMQNPGQAELMGVLWRGGVERSGDALREVFRADYAIVERPLAYRLSKDPRATMIADIKKGELTLYRLR
ncbi:MAG: hypothetical protein EOP11_18565 [Proteobacteria bacterium]|nr:MAG: hypothetical protein EOP11_18565 [Pseudomonadota bacterium]